MWPLKNRHIDLITNYLPSTTYILKFTVSNQMKTRKQLKSLHFRRKKKRILAMEPVQYYDTTLSQLF